MENESQQPTKEQQHISYRDQESKGIASPDTLSQRKKKLKRNLQYARNGIPSKPFVLDCVSNRSKLRNYVSYEDKNLYGFFSKPLVRKQLRNYYRAEDYEKRRKKKARHNSSITASRRSGSDYQGSVVELPKINQNGSVLNPYPADMLEEEEYRVPRLKPVSKGELRAIFSEYRKVLEREL